MCFRQHLEIYSAKKTVKNIWERDKRGDMLMKQLQKGSCFFLFFLLCFLLVPLSVKAEEKSEQKTVRVGWYEDSYHITGENGERSGYGYEYEQAVAAYTGWKYEYVKGDWTELLEMLQDGEIDLMSAVSYTDERAEHMLFSEQEMGEEKYYLYADMLHTDITPSDLSTLNGKRIALLKDSVQATQFYEWEKENNIQTEHVYIDSFEECKQKAINQEIDGVISNETPDWEELGMSAVVMPGGASIYYAINKERSDIKDELDAAMEKMEYDKPFYADELYKKYLSISSTPVLSSEERQWLDNHDTIRIGWVNGDDGISEFDKDSGQLTGVLIDYIQFAKNCLENQTLKFDLVGFDSQEEQMQALKDGKIDMIFHISQNPYIAEQNEFLLSNTVLSVSVAAIVRQNHFYENKQNIVAIKKDDLLSEWYLSYNYPNWDIREYDSEDEVVQAVREGEADCLIAAPGQLNDFIKDKELYNIFLTQQANTAFAVSRENTVLLSILNKTLKMIPSSMLTGAYSMYNTTTKKVTVKDFIQDNLLAVTAGVLVTFLIILCIILSFLRKAKVAEGKARQAAFQSQKLNEKLQESQKELQVALQKAKSANTAKTNFLFNMSHDIRTPMNALLGYNQLMKKELTDPRLLDYQDKIEQSGNLLLTIINNVLDMARIESGKVEIAEDYVQIGDILKPICEVFEMEAKKKGISLNYEVQVEHNHFLCDGTKIREIFLNLISNAVKYTPSGGTVTVRTTELPGTIKGCIRIKTEVVDTGIGMSKEYLPILFEPFSRERNTTIGKVSGTGLGMSIVKKLVDMMGGSIEVESEQGKGTKFTVILQHKITDETDYEQKTKEAEVSRPKELLKGKHALMAEDNELNAEIAKTLLEEMGLIIEHVENGAECVRKMEEMPAGSYDLILMDIQMPEMDGYQATETIRHLPEKEKAEIPIIAMTANAFEEDRKMAFSKGMNAHIAKPIDVNIIEKTLLSIIK